MMRARPTCAVTRPSACAGIGRHQIRAREACCDDQSCAGRRFRGARYKRRDLRRLEFRGTLDHRHTDVILAVASASG
jgi:hypothetical protein